jgi:hypothetical protein
MKGKGDKLNPYWNNDDLEAWKVKLKLYIWNNVNHFKIDKVLKTLLCLCLFKKWTWNNTSQHHTHFLIVQCFPIQQGNPWPYFNI